eukprot:GEMP01012646.1.p1 GENE.GEMP01012646.1~~GEMP01012646.1.p1  ORF type:complete len:648 (+),score=103.31 GEMP01012646.1:50-1993(+)
MGQNLCIARPSDADYSFTEYVKGEPEIVRLRKENEKLRMKLTKSSLRLSGITGETMSFVDALSDDDEQLPQSPQTLHTPRPNFLTDLTSAVEVDQKYEWLNVFIASLWPRVTDYVEAMIKEKVEGILKEKLPFTVTFQELDFGKEPLHLEHMRVNKYQTVTKDGKNDNLYLSMYLKYIGDSNINIALPAGVRVGVSEIKVVGGPLIIEMSQMLPAPPFFSGIQVYFANSPKVDLNWTGVAGMIDATRGGQQKEAVPETDDKDVGGGLLSGLDPTVKLRTWIQEAIESALAGNVVSPNRVGYLMNREINCFDVNKPLPSGIFELKLLKGKNLPAGDWSFTGGSSDPYCIVQIGGVKWTSEVVKSSLNPEWKDASKDFFMYQHLEEITMVNISVYDHDFMPGGGTPDFLGGLIIPLSELTSRKEPGWHNLVVATSLDGPMGPKGQPSQLLLSGIIHPVTLDRNAVLKIKPNTKPSYLLFCGVQEVAHITYEAKSTGMSANKKAPPPVETMTAQLDIVFGEHKESTGACEVPKPDPIDEPEDDSTVATATASPTTTDLKVNGPSEPKRESRVLHQKTSKSFETAYIWPICDLKGEVSITLKINDETVDTHKFKVDSLLNIENLTDDNSIPMNMQGILLTRRFQLRAIERS